MPSFGPFLKVVGDEYYPINVSVGFKAPRVELGFRHMTTRPFDTPEGRARFLKRLAEVPNVKVEDDWVGRLPSFPLTAISDEAASRKFIEVLDWSVNEVKEHNQ